MLKDISLRILYHMSQQGFGILQLIGTFLSHLTWHTPPGKEQR